jgi:hypothetical protein
MSLIIKCVQLFLPDLTPKEDLYRNRKSLVVEAVIQGTAPLHAEFVEAGL